MSVPTNLIPTKITGLPEYTGTSQAGYFPYVLDGTTYKVQFSSVASAGEVPPSRTLTAGTGLVGGGDLSANRVFAIANGGVGAQQLDTTGVVAGVYGNASNIPTVTVDANGRVTSVTTSPVVATGYVPESRTITAGTGLIGGGSLANNITLSLNLSSATPQALGTATAGVSTAAARGDHVHPAVNLSDTNETQGALPLGRGGTGDALSPVAGAVVYSTGTKLAMTNPGVPGQVLVSAGTDEPVWSNAGAGTVTSVDASGGTTGMTFTGGPITLSGTLTLGGTLATGSGGTGLTGTPTNGQLLIGNGTGYALSTLTAGTAVSITNAAGSITIDNTAPDQIVSLTGAGTTSISGTYPNFTITSNDQFTGTVTSVAASGGTTGLTFSGSPITSAGTLTLGGTLAVANGGTGATDAPTARLNLGAAASGANSDITSLSGITGGISTADFVAFDTTNATPPTTGQLAWNVDDGTLDVGLLNNVVLQVGQEQMFYAKNTSGGTIPLGTPVMFTGAIGASGKITFGLAVANGSVPAEYMMGVTTQNVANNGFGYVTTFGLVRGFNTSGAPYGETWADGDLLYFSPSTPGGWTKVEPQAPNIHVPVAVVVNAATGGSGSIFVRMTLSERLGELQDVEINGGGPAAGQVLIYDASQSRWENNTLTAGSNVTITNGNGSITIAATEQFTGTVTSVAASGGTTGLTFSGSPITSAGTLTLGGTLAIGSGGTGATTAGGARTALSAAALGANTDITSIALTSGTILNAPTSGTDIVNKAYADSITSGINFHQSVRLATVAPLPANTYNNGTGGVGATLTANANGALSIDGVAVVAGNRVLVKNEAAQANNGVYVVTQTGSGSTPYILTRATDFDSAGSGVDQIDAGDFFLVTAGSTLANTSWVQQTPLPITVGTTAIVFSQFGAPLLYSAGTGLTLAGTVFSITNTGVSASTYGSASQVPVLAVNAQGQITSASNTSISIAASQVTSGSLAVAQGGTGLGTTPTNGQLLIGNGTGYSLSTLSVGTGISVSNGSGSVTVTNTAPDQIVTITGGGATVVTGTYPNFTVSTTTGTGTVTSVDVSGGSTGLSFTGGPITSSGTLTLGGTLAVANGGTGVTTSTGTGSVVLSTSPTLTTPNLGTPSAATLTNATGLPIVAGTTGTLSVARGGTGQTSFTNGQLLIGNTTGNTLTAATLTAGSNISITNGAGSITIAATDQFTGTVTSVALSGGTTGLTVSGSPITTSGTITLAGTLAVANGGTGVTTSTGTGSVVLSNSPTLVTPTLGAASATSIANGLGAVGTPSYTFTADTNTGMWSPSSDAIAFSTAGSERMRVTSGGDVGIGLTGPQLPLSIGKGGGAPPATSGSTQSSGGIARLGSSGAATLDVGTLSSGSAWLQATNVTNLASNFDMLLNPNGGNVGIGTSSPSSRLTIAGGIAEIRDGQPLMLRPSGNGWDMRIQAAGTQLDILSGGALGSPIMSLVNGGNVGIGTSSPGVRLDVAGGAIRVGNTHSMQFRNAAGTGVAVYTLQSDDNFVVYNATGTPISSFTQGSTNIAVYGSNGSNRMTVDSINNVTSWTVNGSERARINSSGQFLIGTTSGGRTVCINAADNWIRQSNPSRSWLIGMGTGANYVIYDETGGGPRLTVEPATGNWLGPNSILLGSGQNNDNRIEVGQGRTGNNFAYVDLIGDTTYTDYGLRLLRGNSGPNATSELNHRGTGPLSINVQDAGVLVFSTSNTERMRIDSAGSVGIGTSSPGCRFNTKGGTTWLQNFNGSAASPTEAVDWPVPALNVTSFGDFTLQTMMTFTLPNDGNYFTGDTVWNIRLEQTASSTTSSSSTGFRLFGPGYLAFGSGQQERLRFSTSGGITSSDLADAVGYKGLPQNQQTSAYTIALSDIGKHISITTGGVTIPANGTVAFPIGSAVTIYNNSASNQTISITTDTLRLAGTATTGSRTLAQRGICTCVKVATTEWVISGAGLT